MRGFFPFDKLRVRMTSFYSEQSAGESCGGSDGGGEEVEGSFGFQVFGDLQAEVA